MFTIEILQNTSTRLLQKRLFKITLPDESFSLEEIKSNDKEKIRLSVSRNGFFKIFYRISVHDNNHTFTSENVWQCQRLLMTFTTLDRHIRAQLFTKA